MLYKFFRKFPLLIILCSAFLIRLIYFGFVFLRNPDGIYVFDSYGYWQIAFNLREYGVFSQSYQLPLEPDYYRTPLYPFFIIMSESIGTEGISIILAQVILAVLTCYFTFKISIAITASRYISCVSAFIIAIDIPSIVMNTLVLTETLFTFVLIVSTYTFIRFVQTKNLKQLFLSALFCGAAILCRPIGFFIPFLFSFFLLISERKQFHKIIRPLLIFSVTVFLTISPWLIRNKVTFDHYFLSVIREHNMQNYQAAAVYAKLHNRSLPESQSILRWKTFKAFKGDANKQPYEYAKFIERDAINIALENPGILLEHLLKQNFYFFIKPCRAYIDIQLGNWGTNYNTIPKDYPIFKYLFEHNSKLTITLVIFQLILLAVLYLAILFGAVYLKQGGKMFYFLLLLHLVFCFANLTMPSIAESRFRVPVMPYIAILSASGMYFLREKFGKKLMKK
ncbi:MAG: rane protein of unknown function [Bacteroidetes bacterium]|jgi:4-amino-4-deoxy-L-arabinose transferase-like glycosyltransferase|nr:rane protein of unknown function [Bacteroidota bacterium]